LWVGFGIGAILFSVKFAFLFRPRKQYKPIVFDHSQLVGPKAGQVQEIAEADDARSRYVANAQIAGFPAWLDYSKFHSFRLLFAAGFAFVTLVVLMPDPRTMILLSAQARALLFGKVVIGAIVGFFIPVFYLQIKRTTNRTQFLMEISTLSHRLSLCVVDSADLRDVILRASRTLRLLRPYLQEMLALWTKDQHEAIWKFKHAIALSEIYPLVNALLALSRADRSEIAKVLKEQTESIDTALDAEIRKRLESTPVWLSISAMIPFAIGGILFIYPWVITIIQQLKVSFVVQ
jgi:hypothetical protein